MNSEVAALLLGGFNGVELIEAIYLHVFEGYLADTTEQLNNNLMHLWMRRTGKGIPSCLCRDLPNHLVHTA